MTNEQPAQPLADAAIEQMEIGADQAAGDKADAILSSARDAGADAIKQLEELVSRRPLTSLLAAIGAGVALSLLLKRS